jgi:hypothetical protein
MRSLLAYAWAFLPNTLLGLLVAAVSPTHQLRRGVLETTGGLASLICKHALLKGGASAITLGHVIIGRDLPSLDHARNHEHIHVQQYERWGPAFLPAYLACSLYLYLKGQNPYLDNPFEVEAYSKG